VRSSTCSASATRRPVYFREAHEILGTQLPPEHPVLLTIQINLGTAELDFGNLDRAEPLLREAHAIRVNTLGEAHGSTLAVLYEIGRLHHAREEFEEACELNAGGLELTREHLSEMSDRYIRFELELAHALLELGELEEAEAIILEVRQAMEEGRRSPRTGRFEDVDKLLTRLELLRASGD
jgi:tetratricopeptide (TPR) repeat protein